MIKDNRLSRKRIQELKKKIQSKEYLDNAINKIATDLTLLLFR